MKTAIKWGGVEIRWFTTADNVRPGMAAGIITPELAKRVKLVGQVDEIEAAMRRAFGVVKPH